MAGTTGGSGGKRGVIVGINVTPMVDVVLVLLVIMMVSATYIVSQTVQVELPKTATSDDSVSSLASVTITKDRQFLYNGEKVGEPALRKKLSEAYAQNEELNLVVSADTEANHGSVVHVIDVAKSVGIVKFAINVERTE